jgi:hypothetical protein
MTADDSAGHTGESAPPPDPVVLYIGGSGRSGSTVLERTLGAIPGFVNVGELIDLFRRSRDEERCGCGLAFTECAFWSAVGKRGFGGWDSERLQEINRLQGRVARQRHLPQLLAGPMARPGFRADLAAYGACYRTLYRAIAAEAGARHVVDSSKWPVQALALARAGLDVRVLHLARDPRGVAYSVSKKDVARPHSLLGSDDIMWHNSPAGAAARWAACQGQAELLRRNGVRVRRVRYEDFVRQPRQIVEDVLTGLGVPCGPAELKHIGEGRVTLGSSHGLSGNPSRFSDGDMVLRNDEAWREKMPRADRAVVTAIGLPFLVRYGWLRRRRTVMLAAGPLPGRPVAEPVRWPDVSVIITTRGRPELVRETMAAVTGQTYPGDIDCIVVHDQEPPREDLVRLGTARCRIRVLANTHAPGLAGARNTALDVVRGDYVATCDDDDLWHPDKLRIQISRLLEEPELLAVGSGLRLLLPGGKTMDRPGRAERISYQLLLRNRVKELHSSTLVMRRDAFARAGRYDENLPYGYAEDYDWVLRMAKVGEVGLITQPLADIRRNGTSWYQGGSEKVSAGLEYLLAKHPDFARSRRGHARLLGQIAFARSALGDRGLALRLTLKSIARWPASPYPYIALAHIVTGTEPRHLLRVARLFRRETV